jgi:hypothetical protein
MFGNEAPAHHATERRWHLLGSIPLILSQPSRAPLIAGGDDVIELKPMSAIGTKRTSLVALRMSAFGGKADIALASQNVC